MGPIRCSGNRGARRFPSLEHPVRWSEHRRVGQPARCGWLDRTGDSCSGAASPFGKPGGGGSVVRVPRIVGWFDAWETGLGCSSARDSVPRGLGDRAGNRGIVGTSGSGIRELEPASLSGKPGGEASFTEIRETETVKAHAAEATLRRARWRAGSTFGQPGVWVSAHDKLMTRATGK